MTTADKRAMYAKGLSKCAGVFGQEATFPFWPSEAAAGPCRAAEGLRGQSFTADAAPLPPFDDCEHPDQCCCMYGPVNPDWLDKMLDSLE